MPKHLGHGYFFGLLDILSPGSRCSDAAGTEPETLRLEEIVS
jgi:hypothetical protein